MSVVDLGRERRRRSGRRPTLALVGTCSSVESVLKLALDAAEPASRKELLAALAAGTYSDMLVTIMSTFEVDQINTTAAIS